jgi:hypothetical protein
MGNCSGSYIYQLLRFTAESRELKAYLQLDAALQTAHARCLESFRSRSYIVLELKLATIPKNTAVFMVNGKIDDLIEIELQDYQAVIVHATTPTARNLAQKLTSEALNGNVPNYVRLPDPGL